MLLSALVLLTSLASFAGTEAQALLRALPQPPAPAAAAAPPSYDPAARAVSNWHDQTASSLRPQALALTASLAADPPYVARCVRLNNGWCIKSARWPGEIGADGEGHTAFATLADGADAAAHLLRRYYRDYGRRSALAIVRRWAPAECRVASVSSGSAAPAVSSPLAPKGIGRTLRARFLARHRPGGALRLAAPRAGRAGALRIQPWSPLARLAGHPRAHPMARAIPRVPAPQPVADIAVGIEAKPAAVPRPRGNENPAALLAGSRVPSPERMVAESALLPAMAAGLPVLDLRLPVPVCTGDEVRIRAYAGRIAGSVGLKPDDDLHLFGPDGAPLPNLAPVMLAMSAVELGTLRAGPDLVAGAVARLGQEPVRESAADR